MTATSVYSGENMKTNIKVCDAMTRKPISVEKKINVEEAAKIMRQRDIGSLVVIENKKLIGFVTLEEFVFKAIALGMNTKLASIEDIMKKRSEVITISPSEDISDAIELINKHNVRQLPVVDPTDDKIVGLLTIKDILKIEPQMFEILSDKLSFNDDLENNIFSKKYASGTCSACGEYSDKLVEQSGMHLCQKCKD
jgi:CBS domain-containing protein